MGVENESKGWGVENGSEGWGVENESERWGQVEMVETAVKRYQ